jgi:hypothetical protein
VALKAKQFTSARALALCPKVIVAAFCYPRLDVEVSKKMNHLLKVRGQQRQCRACRAGRSGFERPGPASCLGTLQQASAACPLAALALVPNPHHHHLNATAPHHRRRHRPPPPQAPFCVHPKTGKVCVPIQPQAVWEFDPDAVPTVQELVDQLQEVPLDTVAKVGPGC